MDWKNRKIAFVFAGQGAQQIGMAQDFYNQDDEIQQIFQKASRLLGYSLEEICFEDNALIHQTIYTQPAVFVATVAMLEGFLKQIPLQPIVMSGFSLGEYAALYASGVFDFETCLSVVQKRAMAMDETATKNPGAMTAVIGLDRGIVEKVADDFQEVEVANYNAPGQLVVSGSKAGIELFEEAIKSAGARRVVRLQVSGAFHSGFMKEAAKKVKEFVETLDAKEPSVPVIANCTAKPIELQELASTIAKQIESSIYFEDSVMRMIQDYQIDTFIEFGPGNVLHGLIRKIAPTVEVFSVNSLASLKVLKGD